MGCCIATKNLSMCHSFKRHTPWRIYPLEKKIKGADRIYPSEMGIFCSDPSEFSDIKWNGPIPCSAVTGILLIPLTKHSDVLVMPISSPQSIYNVKFKSLQSTVLHDT